MKHKFGIRLVQLTLFLALMTIWHGMTSLGILDPFFFGEPLEIFQIIILWFAEGSIFPHLGITILETILAFIIGTIGGLGCGLWLGLARNASLIFDPYIKGFNAMPRVILAPIFAVWFGLGIWSKVCLGVTLVFFIVFFNVYHGVKQVNVDLISSARVMGASQRQLLKHIYLPSAMAWVFSSLHSAVGMAFVGAVIGEYLGSARGVGYLILQAEGVFDINSVFAGVMVLTACALLLDRFVTIIEKYFMRWQPGSSGLQS